MNFSCDKRGWDSIHNKQKRMSSLLGCLLCTKQPTEHEHVRGIMFIQPSLTLLTPKTKTNRRAKQKKNKNSCISKLDCFLQIPRCKTCMISKKLFLTKKLQNMKKSISSWFGWRSFGPVEKKRKTEAGHVR
jgi:hypothetical protein